MKRLLIMLALLVGIAALADRGLAAVAGNAVATAVQRSENLSSKPDVTFTGFPFLTQAFAGRFNEVSVTVDDYKRDGLVFERVEAILRDVKVGFGDALSGEVEAVPIGSGVATVTMSFADLNDHLGRQPAGVRVSGSDGVLTVAASVPNVGEVRGRATPAIVGSALRVTVSEVRRADGTALPVAAVSAARTRLAFTVNLGNLPFGITLLGVAVEDDALQIAGRADAIVVRVR